LFNDLCCLFQAKQHGSWSCTSIVHDDTGGAIEPGKEAIKDPLPCNAEPINAGRDEDSRTFVAVRLEKDLQIGRSCAITNS
jgi:hypothetical protein